MRKITHTNNEVEQFFHHYMKKDDRKILFIGTVGFNDAGNYFATALSSCKHISYKFFIEQRASIPPPIVAAGSRNRTFLATALEANDLEFAEISIVADDEATVAGRNAVRASALWLNGGYTDIVVDATSMSRGVCFPIIKQVLQFARDNGVEPHILVAERGLSGIEIQSMSGDVACYMHGFQETMETDLLSEALVLWIPQLAENADTSLRRIFSALKPSPAEICPVLPFPSSSPRRADELLVKFRGDLVGWDVNLLDMIYAHESDPLDVCATISRLHKSRDSIFKAATNIPATTVLSPNGWRVGSIGMLLASLEFNLPIMYTENIGYTVKSGSFPALNTDVPPCRWHIWL